MADILKLSGVLILIIVLLRRKIKIGYVMLISSTAMAALYLMGPASVLEACEKTVTDPVTLKLLLALSLIRILELVLREHAILKDMMESAQSIFRSRKAVIASMPLLIGMLPSVGGAYFSAPMVKESTRGLRMSAEEKGFVNHWFRHPWEYILPLYPGILLASALSGIELRTLILANLSYALLMILSGFILGMRQVEREGKRNSTSKKRLLSFVPITAVLALVIIGRMELYLAILIVSVALMAFYRFGAKDVRRAVVYGFSPDVIVLIAGVMLFKNVMEVSGAVENLSAFFASYGIPLMPMLIVLPFIAGLLTGLTIGYVGATFPLLVSLTGGDTVAAVTLAFCAGFLGVLFSPVHVCLVLTREYFKAEMGGIYRRMLVPSALVLAAGVVEYLIL